MALKLTAACAATLATAASAASLEYVPTPAGWMRKDCVFSVASGATVTRSASGFRAIHADGSVEQFPKCTPTDDAPLLRPTAAKDAAPALRSTSSRKLQLPADYDGWLQYSAFHDTSATAIAAMLGNMTTPTSEPASDPDMLYLFPALQNIDWIPKVDPEPKGAFDIIQPVLQYPGDGGNYYSVKSWWVTLDEGALASNEIKLKTGDVIVTNMTQVGTNSWFIDSYVPRVGKHTSLTADSLGPRLASQPWAYITMECYGCTSCSTLPQHNASTAFTGLQLLDKTGAPIPFSWSPNPKPAKDRTCDSSIEIDGSAAVYIYPGTK